MLVERLVANLVENAIRYNTAAGDVWITTCTVAGDSQVIVANTGPLISASDTERIFEPFQRLNERASHDGFGLGLTIVASIAEVHGGTATARPRDEGGLAVIVSFPSRRRPPRTQIDPAPGAHVGRGWPSPLRGVAASSTVVSIARSAESPAEPRRAGWKRRGLQNRRSQVRALSPLSRRQAVCGLSTRTSK